MKQQTPTPPRRASVAPNLSPATGTASPSSSSAGLPSQRQPSSSDIVITGPTKLEHHVHVDTDYNWSGQVCPSKSFTAVETLGEGYVPRHLRIHLDNIVTNKKIFRCGLPCCSQ